jgi:hypothetical protein
VLGEEEPADLRDLRRGDHAAPPRRLRAEGPALRVRAQWAPSPHLVPADEPPAPPADHTPRAGIRPRPVLLPLFMATSGRITGAGRCDQRGRERGQDGTGQGRVGRVMRHAGPAAGAVGALVIPVIEAALGALLVAAPRRAETPDTARGSARRAAIGLTAITALADTEGLPAPAADPETEDLHGPTGPEISGRQWTTRAECGTTKAWPPTPPRGVGAPRGPGGISSRPSPSTSEAAAAYSPASDASHSNLGRVFRFIRLSVSGNMRSKKLDRPRRVRARGEPRGRWQAEHMLCLPDDEAAG